MNAELLAPIPNILGRFFFFFFTHSITALCIQPGIGPELGKAWSSQVWQSPCPLTVRPDRDVPPLLLTPLANLAAMNYSEMKMG
jgi:hypothetical protein